MTSATSSILVPPAGDAMKMGPPAALKSRREWEEGMIKMEIRSLGTI